MGTGDYSVPATGSRTWSDNLAFCEIVSPRARELASARARYGFASSLRACIWAGLSRIPVLALLRARLGASSLHRELVLPQATQPYCELASVRARLSSGRLVYVD